MHCTLRPLLVSVSLLVVGLPAIAQQGPVAPPATSSLSQDDRDFLRNAAGSGLADLQAAQLAMQSATSPEVRRFAQQVTQEQSASGARLAEIAARKGVEMPAEPALVEQGRLKLLQAAEGAEFEQHYVDDLGVRGHQGLVALFQEQAERGQDPDLRRFAQQQLPQLRRQLQAAQLLQSQIAAAQAAPGTSMGAGAVPDR